MLSHLNLSTLNIKYLQDFFFPNLKLQTMSLHMYIQDLVILSYLLTLIITFLAFFQGTIKL